MLILFNICFIWDLVRKLHIGRDSGNNFGSFLVSFFEGQISSCCRYSCNASVNNTSVNGGIKAPFTLPWSA